MLDALRSGTLVSIYNLFFKEITYTPMLNVKIPSKNEINNQFFYNIDCGN